MTNKLNPAWITYNNLQNEGGEGYNPHPKYITSTSAPIKKTYFWSSKRWTVEELTKKLAECKQGAELHGETWGQVYARQAGEITKILSGV